MGELIGLIMPFFIDLINKRITNANVKFIVSLLSCLGVGALMKTAELAGGDVLSVLQTGTIIFTEAQAVYKLFWKDSSARTLLIRK